jgi:hypothetical protein
MATLVGDYGTELDVASVPQLLAIRELVFG